MKKFLNVKSVVFGLLFLVGFFFVAGAIFTNKTKELVSVLGASGGGVVVGKNVNYGIGPWKAMTALPSVLRQHKSVIYNNYLYVVGGWVVDDATATVRYAPINIDGSLGSWINTTALPNAIYDSALVVYGGRLYSLSGNYPGRMGYATTTVRYASINADGSIGSWANTTALPDGAGREGHYAVAYNGYVYVIGGINSTQRDTVYYSAVNADGTLGSWSTTTALPNVRSYHSAVANNGYMYVLSGDAPGVTSAVIYTTINSNGTLGSWGTTTPMPAPARSHGVVVRNGYAYVIGGEDDSSIPISIVGYAPINTDGSISNWVTSALPSVLSRFGIAQNDSYIYLTGGYNGSNITTSEVLYAPIGNGISLEKVLQ